LHFQERKNTNIAPAPSYARVFPEAENVIDRKITPPPSPPPHSIKAKAKAPLPADKAATLTPESKNNSTSLSKPFTLGPSGATQFASNASCTYLTSFPPICGEDNHILSFISLSYF